MLRKVCQQFRGRMEDKQMELRMDIRPEYHYQGDRRLMEKVFTNVIGNAVAYSPVGAVITVTQKDEVFSVENTGVHIAEEDLERIFTPFYRVDKSRNRNRTGTVVPRSFSPSSKSHRLTSFFPPSSSFRRTVTSPFLLMRK